MVKAVLFDMDGLMINTEPLQSQAFEAILKEYGKEPKFNTAGVVQRVGVIEKENWKLMKPEYDLQEDVEVLMKKRGKVYLALLEKNLVPQPGLLALLELFKQHNLPMAVASTSWAKHIELVLDGLGVRQYFSAIASGEFIERPKPFPDIFLEAAEKLCVQSEDCLVLEDSQSGMQAGKAAGAKVIGVPNQFTSDHDTSAADKVVRSLEDIDMAMIESLWQ